MAYSLDEIKKYAANPGSIPAPGTYGEGRVTYARQMLDTLKSSVQSGALTLGEYQDLSAPLVKTAMTTAMNAGGKAGSGAVWQSIVSDGFADASGKVAMPFTKREYATLPDNVLPTQDDINKGMFDPTSAPLQRLRSTPAPAVNPGPNTPAAPGTTPGNNTTTTPGVDTPNHQTGTAPVYTAAPDNPPPYGGLSSTNQAGANDAQRIAQEAALQQQLSTQSQTGVTDQRSKYLSDLSDILTKRNQTQMAYDAPGIYEDLNSRGLLRSSELGNAMSRESSKLNSDTTSQLAQQGIAGETADLGNLTKIQDTYNQGRNSALQREFSVEDYNTQIQAGLTMGKEMAALKPQAPSTKQQVEVAAAGSVPQAAATAATK